MKRQRKQKKSILLKAPQSDSQAIDDLIVEPDDQPEEVKNPELGLEDSSHLDSHEMTQNESKESTMVINESTAKETPDARDKSDIESKVNQINATCVCRPSKPKISLSSMASELESLNFKVGDFDKSNNIILEKISKLNDSYGMLIALTALNFTGLVFLIIVLFFKV
jgi:hypothetical protein